MFASHASLSLSHSVGGSDAPPPESPDLLYLKGLLAWKRGSSQEVRARAGAGARAHRPHARAHMHAHAHARRCTRTQGLLFLERSIMGRLQAVEGMPMSLEL